MTALPALIAEHSPSKTIFIKRADETEYKIEGKVHPKFETLLKVAGSRQANGRHPNIMLVGPTGSGKTHAVEQLAKALGLEFYTNGAISMDHQLLGFKDAAQGVWPCRCLFVRRD
jgi:flagellar biosynthesis GTPase FlhF